MAHSIFKGLPIYDEEAFEELNELFEDNQGQVLAALPWLVSELIEEVGFKKAIEFVYENGGRRIYIGNDHVEFSAKFGLKVSPKLYDHISFGSDSSGYVEIPSPWGVSERFRWAMISCAHQNGQTREEIRQTYGVSRRTLTKLFK